MKRWQRPLFLFSLALNVAFVSLAAVRRVPRDGDVRDALGEPPAPPMRHGAPGTPRWEARRRAAMARILDLDADQRRRLEATLLPLRDDLHAARYRVFEERLGYQRALARGDAGAARQAVRTLSRAQAHVDSLCAEAMLQETAALRPAQRARYVRWTFRAGRGPRHGLPPGVAAPLEPGPPPGHEP